MKVKEVRSQFRQTSLVSNHARSEVAIFADLGLSTVSSATSTTVVRAHTYPEFCGKSSTHSSRHPGCAVFPVRPNTWRWHRQKSLQ